MRRHWKLAVALASFAAALEPGSPAHAADMDPAPDRLYLNPPGIPGGQSCRDVAAGLTGPNAQTYLTSNGLDPSRIPTCLPNNVAWANLMSELGYAIAPSAFHPARTTGFGGFALSVEASFAHINSDAADSTNTQYWHAGTRGPVFPNNHAFSDVNTHPDSILQIYSIKARKGLPFGFEVAGALGYVANTSLWVGGADVHWALLEGYRTGVLGILPDVAIGGGVRTLGGSPDFFLTTVGIDAQLSKPFTLDDSAVVTPYVGAQRLFIFANSTVINLTPGVDPLRQCGYEGANVPGNGYAPGPVYDGSPICRNTLRANPSDPNSPAFANSSDFANQVTFKSLIVHRWRGIAGATYRYGLLYFAGQFAMDLEDPSTENANIGVTGARQWTVSLETGIVF